MSSTGTSDIEVTPEQAQRMVEHEGAQLIDVRETYEWDAGRIAGARHIELNELSSQAETVDRDRPVVFQCRAGVRSAMATAAFRAAGYDAWSMAGGLLRWFEDGLPLEPADGSVADH
ncbi:MAG TPA: rhodanese-like domain-containing protein [Solirubrobacteraceae bacterium]|nr:rhodanese-like domain-containing protein [Solirubrobacteraceae bacterium]